MTSSCSRFVLFCILASLTFLFACNRTPKPQPESIIDEHAAEIYTPSEGSVGFQILSMGGSEDGTLRWLGTYSDISGRTTKFRIELGADKGQILAEEGSDPIPLLESLKTALHAKRLPEGVVKTESVPFSFEMIGDSQVRSDNGTFTKDPKGGWVVMKIALGVSKAKLFFNFNPSLHEAEFAVADPKKGDAVLAEVAGVL